MYDILDTSLVSFYFINRKFESMRKWNCSQRTIRILLQINKSFLQNLFLLESSSEKLSRSRLINDFNSFLFVLYLHSSKNVSFYLIWKHNQPLLANRQKNSSPSFGEMQSKFLMILLLQNFILVFKYQSTNTRSFVNFIPMYFFFLFLASPIFHCILLITSDIWSENTFS